MTDTTTTTATATGQPATEPETVADEPVIEPLSSDLRIDVTTLPPIPAPAIGAPIVPSHQLVVNSIGQAILDGVAPAGRLLPALTALVPYYRRDPSTVRHALDILAAAGIITPVPVYHHHLIRGGRVVALPTTGFLIIGVPTGDEPLDLY